jgi:fructose-specific phosphotransferase system IIC component
MGTAELDTEERAIPIGRRATIAILVAWVTVTTIGGTAAVLLGTQQLMGIGAVAIILGLVSLMPLMDIGMG